MSGYALNSEKNDGNGVKSVEHRRRRHRHRQPHGGIPPKWHERYQWQERQDGMDGTNGTNEYRFLESPNHFANFFVSHPFFVWTFRVQTLANVVHATRCEDGTRHRTHHRRTFFSCARHFINAHALAQDERSSLHFLKSHLVVTCFIATSIRDEWDC